MWSASSVSVFRSGKVRHSRRHAGPVTPPGQCGQGGGAQGCGRAGPGAAAGRSRERNPSPEEAPVEPICVGEERDRRQNILGLSSAFLVPPTQQHVEEVLFLLKC